MGSTSSSHSKGDVSVQVSPGEVTVLAKGIDIAFQIDKNEQACPRCRKTEGMTYTKENDVFTF
ncbi:hypothetical protein BGX23_011300, partial [Mortierella sp. AD031]